ncbi:MAG: 3-hydroxyacyl-CoA dehydrogenase NAD-binding domain-containing protein [Ferruginibacter sp.]
MINTIAVVGAGTMGSGIALAAALKYYPVVLCDINDAIMQQAKQSIEKNLAFLLSKQKITPEAANEIRSCIRYSAEIADCKADIVIEAVVEKLEVKTLIFKELAAINGTDCILASNTSSLSIAAIQQNIERPQRVLGMHFFNPAQVMKLVEVVKTDITDSDVADAVIELCKKLDKTPVLCKDAPGFIVNRVARHFYLEAMKLVEEGIATKEQVDAAIENAGFKMGPFKLMDLIGMDVNLAVSTSLYEAFNKAIRFKPSALQIEKVNKGELGKKTGKGFYEYQL